MRLRNVRGSREIIEGNDYVIQEPENYKGKWKEYFQNNKPIHIEIGMGKGRFIQDLAAQNPGINYIGIEKYSSVLVRAVEKRSESVLNNLVFIRMDAENINDVFYKEEVVRIYLNFSDPWPKDRHAKRRLTSRQFLNKYDNVLIQYGLVIFKTDNRDLFEFSLEEVAATNWKLKSFTYDLHHSEYLEGNIMTEYEERFIDEGKLINQMVAYR
jgi:tRNA (guanine-N7-)-methyltransferase